MPERDSAFFGPAAAFADQDMIVRKRGALLPSDTISDEHCSLLFVPRGAQSREVQAYSIGASCSRLLVVLEEASSVQARVWLGCGNSESSHSTEIFLEDGAELSLLFVQESDAPALTIKQRSSVGANATLHMQNVSLGAGKLHHDLLSDVRGARGRSSVDWIFYAKGSEQQHINVCNTFHARDGEGEIVLKGVAEDRAYTLCTGMIVIGAGGGGTDTYLTEDILMLDRTAKVDAVPGLEIKTNDVKASHSATVSKVTSDALFYFSSRGISEDAAREMYVLGFLGDLTQRIANEKERAAVIEAIERKYQREQ